jgi:hypothetical protein
MARKTIEIYEKEVEELNSKIEELQALIETLEPERKASPHLLLDECIDHFEKNAFVMRGVDSSRIWSMLISCRELLKKATKK